MPRASSIVRIGAGVAVAAGGGETAAVSGVEPEGDAGDGAGAMFPPQALNSIAKAVASSIEARAVRPCEREGFSVVFIESPRIIHPSNISAPRGSESRPLKERRGIACVFHHEHLSLEFRGESRQLFDHDAADALAAQRRGDDDRGYQDRIAGQVHREHRGQIADELAEQSGVSGEATSVGGEEGLDRLAIGGFDGADEESLTFHRGILSCRYSI